MLIEPIAIASFPHEQKLAKEITEILAADGIHCSIRGSRVYEILVPAAERDRAAAVLALSAVAGSLRFR